MKDRIDNLLRVEGITSSKFADEIGVQRSSISHILSGRNNPSLDLIQKILSRYRNINAEWLISGRGDMFKNSASEPVKVLTTVISEVPDIEPDLYSDKSSEKIDFSGAPESSKVIEEAEIKHIERILVFYSDKTFDEYFKK
ncbi:MAG: hypothetical protein A2W91_10755 [Bacteroidetes bacterium GWF2_38_335]|nr:MAG: hypothetical protein A2W91_10755 [Bacteroidetes bacterium GWF2_38_335]OFY81818.1 MAG: hypothetical protein A2281_06285 [Bacteroidetes bacterium RIFOXYA12_FULL_38_20]HBS87891.1 transcriptional regulator [Bacteroidales bacterium]